MCVFTRYMLYYTSTRNSLYVRALIPHTSWARLYDHDSPTSTPQPLSPPLSSVLFLSLRRESAAGYGTPRYHVRAPPLLPVQLGGTYRDGQPVAPYFSALLLR